MPPDPQPTPPRPSPHRHAVAAAVLLTLMLAMLAVREAWAAVVYAALSDGLLAAGWAAAMAGIGWHLLPRAWLGDEPDSAALRLATRAAGGIGVTSLLLLALGSAGGLNGAAAWSILAAGWVAAGVGVTAWRRRRAEAGLGGPLRFEVSGVTWLWVPAAPALAVLLAAPAVLPGVLWGDEPHGYDVVSYHLQIPREWYESGRVFALPHNVFSFFPLSMELHALLAMRLRGGPWAGMYLAQYMHALTVPLTALAAYGALRARGRAGATVAAVLVLATPWLPMVGTVAYNEGLLVLFATLAVAWLMRANAVGATTDPRPARRAVVVAGAMAGFAYGAKMTALATVIAPGAILAILASPVIWRRFTLPGAFLLVALAAAAPWMVRTALASGGNPFFPLATGVFGRGPFSEAQVERWKAAHAPRDDQRSPAARGRAFVDQVLADWRYGYALLPAAGVALAVGRRDDRRRLLAAFLLAQVIVWIGFTHLQGRFLTAAIPAAAMLVGLAPAGVVRWILSAGAVAASAACSGALLARLAATPAPAFGVTDPAALWQLQPDPVAAVVKDSPRPVALAGDARAFWWPLPKGTLHYRTVFDVDVRNGESLLDAWTRSAPADATVVVDPNELRRFAATYRRLGPPPAEIEGRGEPFVRGR